MSEVYRVDVDRIVITGARTVEVGASELRVLLESAVRREIARAPLPAGRTMHAAVRIDAPSLGSGAPAIANAVAAGISRAVGGGR